MAIFHLSVKPVSRSSGRSATAAAAYRSGCEITDERTGQIHDYTRKGGVESAEIVLPDGAPEWAADRSKLWNVAELAENRKDACVAREYVVALPSELSPEDRRGLAMEFAKDMANREGCAVDVAIHAPNKEGDDRNHHAHMLRTTRKVEVDGLGDKLDTEKAGRKRKDDLEAVRDRWAGMTNERLREAGIDARVDHRSLKDQGIDREPTIHLGVAATGYERRTGEPSEKRQQHDMRVSERLSAAKEIGELDRKIKGYDSQLIDLSGDIKAAKAERDFQIEEKNLFIALEQQEAREAAQAAKDKPLRDVAVGFLWEKIPKDSIFIEFKKRVPEADAARIISAAEKIYKSDLGFAKFIAQITERGKQVDVEDWKLWMKDNPDWLDRTDAEVARILEAAHKRRNHELVVTEKNERATVDFLRAGVTPEAIIKAIKEKGWSEQEAVKFVADAQVKLKKEPELQVKAPQKPKEQQTHISKIEIQEDKDR